MAATAVAEDCASVAKRSRSQEETSERSAASAGTCEELTHIASERSRLCIWRSVSITPSSVPSESSEDSCSVAIDSRWSMMPLRSGLGRKAAKAVKRWTVF